LWGGLASLEGVPVCAEPVQAEILRLGGNHALSGKKLFGNEFLIHYWWAGQPKFIGRAKFVQKGEW